MFEDFVDQAESFGALGVEEFVALEQVFWGTNENGHDAGQK